MLKKALPALLALTYGVPLKLDYLREVAHDEVDAMPPGVNMKLMGDATIFQDAIELLCALLEPVIVVVADVEVDAHSFQVRDAVVPSEIENVVPRKVLAIEGGTKHIAKQRSR